MIAVKGAPRRVARNPGVRYAQLLEAHERNEKRLARAVRAWDKSRAALRRAEKLLDASMAAQAGEPAPELNDTL